MAGMNLRDVALEVARILEDVGKHAYQDQLNPRDMASMMVLGDPNQSDSAFGDKLVRFIENRLTYINTFQGFWRNRPENCNIGDRFWCVGNIDGAINFNRDMAEWTLTVSLFEFNDQGSARPVLGVVHAPALGLTYLAAKGQGAIRIRKTPNGEKREKITPSTTSTLHGSVVCYGMSYIPGESKRALDVVSSLEEECPADIKRIGPASLDLCKVADGTYDAYFEPHLHRWDIPGVSAGAVVVKEAQGHVRQWNGDSIHWRRENDVIASNGLINKELQNYLR
ncbi:inositol monophosphatase family protein [Gardnerella vaginalis]|jgi:inositol monophosphatase|uniref:inositol monophosphatase family protein n=1 Tax=Gardnerella vaginalis TaxID=2702 RepID=UPI00020D71A4|nr:inositol monophosphatase family protein [Gardnerella vaginalis]EGL13851.1 inositol monophosphatase family protein [Gardnerella vaginalis 315-A]NSX30399.1 inositol monophosphatase family protein [Gardnerella vaginalis]PKZ45441.1 inositol monophosphatase family protein [Gardnerella vaginalis]PKZ46706.1 inositol monophosphatase family protein [Gardnerella vaginalis]RIY23749.1 inositol monophosphatase [Gardnerella vaginalis]